VSVYAVPSRDAVGRTTLGLAVALAAAALAAASVLSPAGALALVLGLGFVAITFRDFTWGVALFTIVTFFDRLPGVGGLESTAAKAAGAVLATAWLIRIASRKEDVPLLARAQPLVAYSAIFFVGWGFMSTLWAEDSGTAISSSVRLVLNVLLLFIVFSAVRSRRDLMVIVGVYIAGAAFTALVGLGGGTSSEDLSPYAETGRLAGQIGDPNEFAAVLVPALVFAAFLFVARRGALSRWLLGCCAALFGLAFFLTNSRGGLVALGVTFVVTLFAAGPVRSRAVVAILLVGALGFAYYTLVAPPEQLQRITQFSAGGGTGRQDLWTVALRIYGDHPLAGIGIGNFKAVEPRYAYTTVQLQRPDLIVDTPKVVHNTYLHVLTELGTIGAFAFAIVIVGALLALRRAIRTFRAFGDVELEVIARGVLIATIGVLAAFTFISAQYEKQLWLLLGLAAATATVARRAPEALEEAAYDLDVREQLVEQLEQRIVERMDALLAEQERLSRRRLQLAARENELRERLRALEERERGLPAADRSDEIARLRARVRELEAQPPRRVEPSAPELERLRAREAVLQTREQGLAERVAALTAREQALARRAGELAERERAAAEEQAERERLAAEERERTEAEERVRREREAEHERAAVAQAAPATPAPEAEPAAPAAGGEYNLGELEVLVARRAHEFPDRTPEWESYLFFLRDHAAPDGRLPAQFDYLVEDVFGDIFGR
jgi:O-antigen ligase